MHRRGVRRSWATLLAAATPVERRGRDTVVHWRDRFADPVVDAVVDEVFAQIRTMHREATLIHAVRIGKLIVDRFYGGRLEPWRQHGNKEISLRKLAARLDADERAGISSVGLFRLMALYELDTRLHLVARTQLSVTHARAVLGLPEDQQRDLLAQAEEQGWSTRTLEQEVAQVPS